MARPTGTQHTESAPRKRLVQPVLPALPLLPKAKKEVPKVEKEEETALENGTALAVEIVPESAVDPQPGTPTNNESTISEDVVSPAGDNEIIAGPEEELEGHTDADVNENVVIHAVEKEPLSDEIHKELDLTNDVIDKFERESPGNGENLINASSHPYGVSGEGGEVTGLHTEIGEREREMESVPRFELEAAVSFKELLERSKARRSAQASVSNSSIQQTPLLANASPVTPEVAESAQQEENVNGGNHVPLEVSMNGHATPARQPDLSMGRPTRPGGLSTYPTVLEHIRQIQYAPDWFDCEICVYYPYSTKPVIYRNAHSLVLIRSERLRNFIYPQRASSFTYYIVNLYPSRQINLNAFDAALRFLYADTVLSGERLYPAGTLTSKAEKARALDYVLSYLSAGLELGVEPVITRALDLIGRLLDWDIAELALKEAVRLRSSALSARTPQLPSDTLPAAKSILQHVFNLVVLQINPHQFRLDVVSTPTDLVPRLAMLDASRAVINPALANIAFGSMPASTDISPTSPYHETPVQDASSSPATTASIIMLNMDFEDLCRLAGEMQEVHGASGVRIISEVVDERERRRLHILNNRAIPNKQRVADPMVWDVIGWREYMANNMLQRERVGFMLPLSSRRKMETGNF